MSMWWDPTDATTQEWEEFLFSMEERLEDAVTAGDDNATEDVVAAIYGAAENLRRGREEASA